MKNKLAETFSLAFSCNGCFFERKPWTFVRMASQQETARRTSIPTKGQGHPRPDQCPVYPLGLAGNRAEGGLMVSSGVQLLGCTLPPLFFPWLTPPTQLPLLSWNVTVLNIHIYLVKSCYRVPQTWISVVLYYIDLSLIWPLAHISIGYGEQLFMSLTLWGTLSQ